MLRSIASALCVLIALAAFPAAADSKADKVSRLMALDGAEAVVNKVIDRQLPVVREAFRTRYPAAEAVAEDVYVETFAKALLARRGELIAAVSSIYAASFEEEELDELLAFFDSALGRKYRAAAPELLSGARQQGRAWGQAHAAELTRMARDAVLARGLKLK